MDKWEAGEYYAKGIKWTSVEPTSKLPILKTTKINRCGYAKMVMHDGENKRIVVTFNRTQTDTERLSSFFSQEKLQTILLNKVNHRQRLHSLHKEKQFEAL